MLSFYQPTRETHEFASLLSFSVGEAWSDVFDVILLENYFAKEVIAE
jgi:hypothetical protein